MKKSTVAFAVESREKVWPSCDRVVSRPLADTVYVTGRRGSRAEKNGMAFRTSTLRDARQRLMPHPVLPPTSLSAR